MSQAIVTAGQSLVDIAIQELGSVASLFDLADAAGLAITDVLTPGQLLPVPAAVAADLPTAAYFRQRGQHINTGSTAVPAPRPEAHDFDFLDFDHADFDTI